MHALLLAFAALLFPTLHQPAVPAQASEEKAAAAEPRHLNVVVLASAAEVWQLFTSGEAWTTSYNGAKIEVDLRRGGQIRGGESPIAYTILAYEPERMIAVSFIAPDTATPESRVISERAWSVFRLEPLASDRTRVTVTLMGCDDKGKYAPLCDSLSVSQQTVIVRIASHFIKLRQPDMQRQADELRSTVAKLKGEWSCEQRTADGVLRTDIKAASVFDDRFLMVETATTGAGGSVEKTHIVFDQMSQPERVPRGSSIVRASRKATFASTRRTSW